MSKNQALAFLNQAANDADLQAKLQTMKHQDELVALGQEAGFEFAPSHVGEALKELKQQPNVLQLLAESVLEIFSPAEDDYPATGVQPFSGEPSR